MSKPSQQPRKKQPKAASDLPSDIVAYTIERKNGLFAPVKYVIESGVVVSRIVGVEDLAPHVVAKVGRSMVLEAQGEKGPNIF